MAFDKENDAGGTGASAGGNELTAPRRPHCALNRKKAVVVDPFMNTVSS